MSHLPSWRSCVATIVTVQITRQCTAKGLEGQVWGRSTTELPADWGTEQRSVFIDSEAAKISYRVAEMGAEMGTAAVAHWTRRHGAHPDYLTHVGLLNSARASAMEIVLNDELYELIRTPADSPLA